LGRENLVFGAELRRTVRGGDRLGDSRPRSAGTTDAAALATEPALGIRSAPPSYHSTEFDEFLNGCGLESGFLGPNSVERYAAAIDTDGRGNDRVN
jgi:hypothetical protein